MGKFEKSVTLLILGLFLISFISAQEVRFFAQKDSTLDITDSCQIDGIPCSASFNCNITIINPLQEVIVLNQQMTRNDTIYNFTLNSNQTNLLGFYEDSICCNNVSIGNCDNFFHQITTSGSEPIDSGKGFVLTGIMIILIVATIFFLVFGILSKNAPFKVFFVSLSVILLVGTLGFGVTIMQQLMGTFTNLVSGYGTFYKLLIILLSGGALGIIIYLIVVAFKSIESHRRAIENV
jgi:hypothetical protein|tara:strand:- start:1995 stop:2702 length:708 start_codon:yes stop_codon:yes gene_type:complete